MWKDMVLYWAWSGEAPKDWIHPLPTKKRIEYAEIVCNGRYMNGDSKGEPIHMSLAVTVFDDSTPKEVNRDELEWHRKNGAVL